MNRAFDGVIAPPSEEISGVDYNGALNRCGIHKLSRRAPHLKPSSIVLKEECNRAIILLMVS
jgi:hypothetical protein